MRDLIERAEKCAAEVHRLIVHSKTMGRGLASLPTDNNAPEIIRELIEEIKIQKWTAELFSDAMEKGGIRAGEIIERLRKERSVALRVCRDFVKMVDESVFVWGSGDDQTVSGLVESARRFVSLSEKD